MEPNIRGGLRTLALITAMICATVAYQAYLSYEEHHYAIYLQYSYNVKLLEGQGSVYNPQSPRQHYYQFDTPQSQHQSSLLVQP